MIINIQHINKLYIENPKLKEQVNILTHINLNNILKILKLRKKLLKKELLKKELLNIYIYNLVKNNLIKTRNNKILKIDDLIFK